MKQTNHHVTTDSDYMVFPYSCLIIMLVWDFYDEHHFTEVEY